MQRFLAASGLRYGIIYAVFIAGNDGLQIESGSYDAGHFTDTAAFYQVFQCIDTEIHMRTLYAIL